jgi:hypothetical protein
MPRGTGFPARGFAAVVSNGEAPIPAAQSGASPRIPSANAAKYLAPSRDSLSVPPVRAADHTNEALAATLFVNLRLPIAPQRETVAG